jgi:hypothetical protein
MVYKPGIAVVFHHIGPYHHARLNAVADRFSVIGVEWSAKGYDSWGAADSPARYRKVSLFSEATDQHPAKAELRRAFWSALERANPHVVAVNGWNNFGSLIAANCCVRLGIPMVVMSESARQDEPRTWWKETIKRRIVNLYSAALVGARSRNSKFEIRNSKKVWAAGELLPCVGAIHREKESPDAHSWLCALPRELARQWSELRGQRSEVTLGFSSSR